MKLSLVTPNFNGATFLEQTLLSVLDQRDAQLEYGVVDGGSTDGSLDILGRYADKLDFTVSEADRGMYDALAKGFARCTGDVMGYLGSDDLHLPSTLSLVREIFSAFPEIKWITSQYPLTCDGLGRVVRARKLPAPCARHFFQGRNLPGFTWYSDGWLQQESTFWRRDLWEAAGGFDTGLRLAGDFDLWCRFFKLAEPVTVATPLAMFRRHGNQISSNQAAPYREEALASLLRHGGKTSNRYVSRGWAALERLGLSSSGRVASFDFTSRRWCLSSP
jgi:glycosyltransferase involved in cell wall biosynthesis